MAKPRPKIPSSVRAKLFDEFNHQCAICGAIKPQLHHIDEDPANNDVSNLLPLCPNHHLTDQHNPTRRIEPGRLKLFREYKDPSILWPQFQGIYSRLNILFSAEAEARFDLAHAGALDLCHFVGQMKMGRYYQERIARLLLPTGNNTAPGLWSTDEISDVGLLKGLAMQRPQLHEQFLLNLRSARSEVSRLVVELLRYQEWSEPRPLKN